MFTVTVARLNPVHDICRVFVDPHPKHKRKLRVAYGWPPGPERAEAVVTFDPAGVSAAGKRLPRDLTPAQEEAIRTMALRLLNDADHMAAIMETDADREAKASAAAMTGASDGGD